ncbi:MAG: PQQ-dependent sugar dehydrogenase [bacterium]|nr:PQQ-dependent sugar dehydrogenase [bacterium]MDE0600874.1 PQQ-dependent sugar dehydrogenase [bacterium]
MQSRIGRRAAWLAVVLMAAACSAPQEEVRPPEPPPTTTETPLSSTMPASPSTTGTTAEDPSGEAQPPPDVTSTSEDDPASTDSTTTTSLPTVTSPPAEPEEAPPTTRAPPPDSLRFVEVAQGAQYPIFLTASKGAGHSYLAEQGGRVLYLLEDEIGDQPVLDISEKVTFRGEQGLLGIALHPVQPTRLFVHYSNLGGHTVVSEFSLSDDGRTADPESERIIFFTQQPATNHNGGMIQFGPDGYLYLGLGDGGRAGDYYGHGQRPDTFLAALVRIHPDQVTSEVWWYGLRNPWRFWIDEPTGLTYIADVGQDAYEEISVASLSEPGLNFGWPITEGFHCFEPNQGCDPTGLTLPVLEIAHDDGGTCSVTGGVVYRGSSMPGLHGHYFYSDYCGGYLRSFRWDGTLAMNLREWTPDLGNVVSFGTDGSGEMYVLTTEAVYRVEPAG